MSYNINIYNAKGEKIKTSKLDTAIFNQEHVNPKLINDFVKMQLANSRHPIAHTKTRGEVNYSGKKLYRQKGTGRARVGNAGSPIRRKGGVAFGPRNTTNHSKSMPKKMRRKALFGALSLKAKDKELIGLDAFPFKEAKTKDAFETIKNLKLDGEKVLFVIANKNDTLIKSFRNLPKLKYVIVDYINPYDLLTHKKVLFMQDSIERLNDIFVK